MCGRFQWGHASMPLMRLYFQWWDTYWNWKTCWNQRKIVLVSLQIPPSLPEVSVRRWVSDLPLSSQRSWSFRWPSRRSWYSLRGIYWKPDMLDGWYAMTHMPWSSTHPLFCNSWQSGQVRTSSLLRDFNSEVFLVFFFRVLHFLHTMIHRFQSWHCHLFLCVRLAFEICHEGDISLCPTLSTEFPPIVSKKGGGRPFIRIVSIKIWQISQAISVSPCSELCTFQSQSLHPVGGAWKDMKSMPLLVVHFREMNEPQVDRP